MQTSTEQPFLPTAVNILRLRDYVLPPDGVVLFDWFVVKQACFRSGSFHYSQARIQAETRIARHRQDSLITQFCEWDFLVVFVNFNPATGGRVRFFSLDYAALADPGVLTHVVRKDSDLFAHYLNYFTHMSARLNTPKASTPTPAEEQAQAERVYHLLNRTFNERRKFYNLGGLTQGVRPVQPLPPQSCPGTVLSCPGSPGWAASTATTPSATRSEATPTASSSGRRKCAAPCATSSPTTTFARPSAWSTCSSTSSTATTRDAPSDTRPPIRTNRQTVCPQRQMHTYARTHPLSRPAYERNIQ